MSGNGYSRRLEQLEGLALARQLERLARRYGVDPERILEFVERMRAEDADEGSESWSGAGRRRWPT